MKLKINTLIKKIDRTKEIIKLFNIKNSTDLPELYNETDVILLADIFENFIKVSISEFGINPLYYISLRGTTWSNSLIHTKVELELIEKVDLFQMFENGIRGGINGVFGNLFSESINNIKVLHLDMNNLYGFVMLQHLPIGNFQIYEINSLTESFIDKVLYNQDCSIIGYVLIVDLICPDNIRDKSTNFPFCPENEIIDPNNVTEYM